jgi:3-hydroxybutyryl-CoA dehydrogenase
LEEKNKFSKGRWMSNPEIRNITIIGAGTMGHSIGQEFAMAGFQVGIYDQAGEVRENVLRRIEKNLVEMTEWDLMPAAEVSPALERIQVWDDLQSAVDHADLVVEAVFENLEIKQALFKQLDKLCPPHTILASNTSSLMPSSLAAVTKREDRVLVLHYFYPPHLMPLVEIVKSEHTSQQSAKAVYDAVMKAHKKPIITHKEVLGFVANRLQAALLREAMYIIEQGVASAKDVDISVKYGFGRRLAHVGPVELAEVQDGWAQMGQIQEYIFPDLNNASGPGTLVAEKVTKNELGPRTGQGFYPWPPGKKEDFEHNLYEQLANYVRADRSTES